MKGDEQVLGDSTLVLDVLDASQEHFERKHRLQAQGYTLEKLARRVAPLCGITPEQIYSPGKYPRIVQARSLFCYWAIRELGVSATELARKLGLSQPAVSISVKRGERIAREKKLSLKVS